MDLDRISQWICLNNMALKFHLTIERDNKIELID